MARIRPVPIEKADPEVKTAFFRHVAEYKGRINNMKATLGHSLTSFEAYMQWYPLYNTIQRILGGRLACLYAYSISASTNCTFCTTFFRKMIIEAGEDPEHLTLKPEEQLVLDFGSEVARSHGNVREEMYRWISLLYNDRQLVILIAFAGQMIATNVFNNVVKTEIDEDLIPFIPQTEQTRPDTQAENYS